MLSREEFLDLFLDDLELPDLAKRALAEAESERPQRAGYTTSGSPSNVSIERTVRRAMMRRIALGRPRREEITLLESSRPPTRRAPRSAATNCGPGSRC